MRARSPFAGGKLLERLTSEGSERGLYIENSHDLTIGFKHARVEVKDDVAVETFLKQQVARNEERRTAFVGGKREDPFAAG